MSPQTPLDRNDRAALEGLDAIEAAQVRRCARVLLRRPLLRAEGADGETLGAVRRYADRLQALFAGYLGYRLVVEPTFARLYKPPRASDGVRRAHKTNGAPFTPRGYAYLALVLAVLAGSSGQALLSGLVAEVRAAGAEAGLDLGTGIVDRRALVAALRHLIDLGVLTETDGAVAPWTDDADREALLTVDVELLGHAVAAPRAQRPADERAQPAAPDHAARTEAGAPGTDDRHLVRRRLVEDPVVPRSELSAEQWDWLRTHLRGEADLLEDLTGMRLEARAEGVLAVDPEGYLTDHLFPGHGTTARIALLTMAELLAPGAGEENEQAAVAGWIPVGLDRLGDVAAGIVERYPRAWSKEAVQGVEPGSSSPSTTVGGDAPRRRLARAVAQALAHAGLARLGGDLVEISPAAARYRPRPNTPGEEEDPADGRSVAAEPGEGQQSLFTR